MVAGVQVPWYHDQTLVGFEIGTGKIAILEPEVARTSHHAQQIDINNMTTVPEKRIETGEPVSILVLKFSYSYLITIFLPFLM